MKRLLSIALFAALVLSCKGNVDVDAPAISWGGNEKFAQIEMGAKLSSLITVTAPLRIQTLTLTLDLGDYNLVANQHISISDNKADGKKLPVFDMIDDTAVSSFISGYSSMGVGSALRGKKDAVLYLEDILNAILKGQEIPNNKNFSIEILLTDQAGNSISKTAKFHNTSAPSVVWLDNSKFETVNLTKSTTKPYKIRIVAPGKVKELTVTLDDGAPELDTYVRNRTTGSQRTIDLVNDAKVADAFKFPSSKNVSGKTEVNLEFLFMYDLTYDLSPYTNVFTVKAVDANGKEGSAQLKFVVE